MSFVWLKDLSNNIRQYKESDKKTIDSLISSGRWTRVKGRRDLSPYSEAKKTAKKKTKKLNKKK
tara:strand:+ start:166 stop:357 length:192 start_codon:yes stop_codon:yes gene_type:complete